jgi:hypothetical protein
MENTNPQGSVDTVNDAAGAFLKMMEPEEPQGQPEEEVAEYEAQDEEQEESEEEVQETPRYRVKTGDEEVEVDLDELIKGYSRTSDYTKKTQNLAEQRKVVEAERSRIEEAARLRDQYAQRLQVIEQLLTQPEEDLNALKDQDPIGYAVKMGERMEKERQLAAVRQEQQQIAAYQQAEYQQRLQATLSSEAERLRAAIPEFADKEKGESVRRELRDLAKSVGYSDQELSAVYDHRALLVLYKAAQYDRLTKGKVQTNKKVSEAPRMLKPGTTQPRNAKDDQLGKLRKQLSNSGKKTDAARLFEQFL